MKIRELSAETGSITVTLRYEELRTLTNLLYKARKKVDFNATEYELNAALFTAVTILSDGMIPKIERKHINEMYETAEKMRAERGQGL